jgi:YVTN family beta-propeller protein
MNDHAKAQVSQNRIESIVSHTDVLTSAQVNVHIRPNIVDAKPYRDNIYVQNSGSNTVSVINSVTNTVIKNIPVGDGPSFIYAPPFGNNIYVANTLSNTVSVINSVTNTVIKNIPVGDGPSFIDTYEDPMYGDNIYVANAGSNTISVIDPNTNTVIKNITVGDGPSFIDASPFGNNIYVASSYSNIVSVINSTTNTVIKNITVGDGPLSIDAHGDSIYVANALSNTVSIIDPATNAVIKDIVVGNFPIFIYIYGDTIYGDTVYHDTMYEDTIYGDNIYVANAGSNTVSVINSTTNTVIKNITVGNAPFSIDAHGDSIYVANYFSNTVSVIDSVTNEVVAGVKFDINPFEGGQIICNGLDAPINRYFYVSSGTECVAKPNNGFEFSSWTQNLAQNSTITINASTPSNSLWTPLLDIFGVKSNDPAANLTVNRFGNFTAYFRALPPPVPAEYWASLFTVVVTALVGLLLIPAAVRWLKSKKQTSRLNSFHQQMALVFADGKMDENDTNQLNILNKNISDSYAAGKINNEQYTHLKNEVSTAYQEIFKKRIESITEQNTEAFGKIKNDIKGAYSAGEITELHYNLLNETISDILSNNI